MKNFEGVLLFASSMLLVACGGGGGSGGNSPVSYNVSATAGNGGSISPGSRSVVSGQTATFTLTADTDYSVAEVTGCNGSLNGNTYTTGAITSVCSVSASFKLNSWALSVGQTALTIPENSSATVSFSITGSSIVAVSATTTGSAAVSSSVASNVVTINVTELQQEGTATLTLTATGPAGKTEVKTVALTLENTSVKTVLADAAVYKNQSSQLADMTVEQRAVQQLGKLAYYTAAYSQAKLDELIAQATKTAEQKAEMQALLSQDLQAAYLAGTINETEAQAKLQQAVAAYGAYHEPMRVALKTVSTDAGVAVLNLSAPVFDVTSKTLSAFVGNTSLGSYQNNQWIFSQNFQYLTDLVFPSTCTL
jgi:hypothetical protein